VFARNPAASAGDLAMLAASTAVLTGATVFAAAFTGGPTTAAAHGIIHTGSRIYTTGPGSVGIAVRQRRRGGRITRSSSSAHVLFRVSKNSPISFGHA
jgi:hypothetical protein